MLTSLAVMEESASERKHIAHQVMNMTLKILDIIMVSECVVYVIDCVSGNNVGIPSHG